MDDYLNDPDWQAATRLLGDLQADRLQELERLGVEWLVISVYQDEDDGENEEEEEEGEETLSSFMLGNATGPFPTPEAALIAAANDAASDKSKGMKGWQHQIIPLFKPDLKE